MLRWMSVFSCYFHYGNQTQRMYGFSLIFGFSILAWPSLMASSSTWCTWYYGNSKPRQLNKVRNKFDYWMLANKTASLIFPNSWQSKYGKAEISVFLTHEYIEIFNENVVWIPLMRSEFQNWQADKEQEAKLFNVNAFDLVKCLCLSLFNA